MLAEAQTAQAQAALVAAAAPGAEPTASVVVVGQGASPSPTPAEPAAARALRPAGHRRPRQPVPVAAARRVQRGRRPTAGRAGHGPRRAARPARRAAPPRSRRPSRPDRRSGREVGSCRPRRGDDQCRRQRRSTGRDPRHGLASVRVARRLSLPAQCEIAFALDRGLRCVGRRRGGRCPDRRRHRRHRRPTTAGPLFEGDVTAHEWVHAADGAAELRVRAYDPLHRLRKRQRVVARTDLTVADLAAELAGDAGLAAKADERRAPLAGAGPAPPVRPRPAGRGGRAGRAVVRGASTGPCDLFSLDGIGDAVDLVLHDTLLAARFDATVDPACRYGPRRRAGTRWPPVG